jgi:predicted DNA-binding helix-hairpin-helix protein
VLDADTTMEKMRGIVERLRLREGYTGSIHLTLIPGASDGLDERAVELADRVRLNLEAPNQAEQLASAGERQHRSLNEAS